MGLEIKIRNPNFFAIDYSSIVSSIFYRRELLGSMTSVDGRIEARKVSYVDADLHLDGSFPNFKVSKHVSKLRFSIARAPKITYGLLNFSLMLKVSQPSQSWSFQCPTSFLFGFVHRTILNESLKKLLRFLLHSSYWIEVTMGAEPFVFTIFSCRLVSPAPFVFFVSPTSVFTVIVFFIMHLISEGACFGSDWRNGIISQEVLLGRQKQGATGALDEGAWTVGSEHQSPPFILVGVLRAIPPDSTMASFVPSVTFRFGTDAQVTLPESLLASPPAEGITFGSFTDSAFATLGWPNPAEAAAFSPPQRRGRAAMRPFGRPVARRTAQAHARPTPVLPVAQTAPAPQCRQAVVTPIVVPAEAARVRVPPPSSSRKRGAQTETPSPSFCRVSAFARLSHPETLEQSPTLPVLPVPTVAQVVGSDVASSSAFGLGRRARRNRNRRLRLAASEADRQRMADSLAHQEPVQRRVVPRQRAPRPVAVSPTPDVTVAPEIAAVQGGRFSPLTHSGDEEDVACIAAAPPVTTTLPRARVPRDDAARTLSQRIRSIIRLARGQGPASVHLLRQRYQWRRGQPPRQPVSSVPSVRPHTVAPDVGRCPRRHGRRQQLELTRPQFISVMVATQQSVVPTGSCGSGRVWRRRQADSPVEAV
ncbi:hypothetical protein IEQ34_012323 [Dendrobium chrysotoxum]|uniref:Late embryogenesis abundant protein LEA-2 subgroup domain-containing protein n=1 Tax=Dendrobium chrysotoxum TaxID=161865 RepID=A0AAV7GCM2_DENCH|nr:hypothetical protein IEQ34_012323 [Dendrobium chrysotoxum]